MYIGLPDYCYVESPKTSKPVRVEKGISGYYSIITDKTVDELNSEIGVTKAQEKAMLEGATSGWDTPASDPSRYLDEEES